MSRSLPEGICTACLRTQPVRSSPWHTPHMICVPCFIEWYDPDREEAFDNRPFVIGNYVRKKNGLAPFESQESWATEYDKLHPDKEKELADG